MLVASFLASAGEGRHIFGFFCQLVAGIHRIETRIVVFQAIQFVIGRVERFVGHQQDADALLEFDFGDLGALFVQQEAGHFHWHLHQHSGCVVFERLFLDDAQDLKCRAFGVADVAGAAATWAGNGGSLAQCGTQTLAAHFQQTELADGAKLYAGTILAQGIAQAVLHLAAVFGFFHVDEIDHDQPAQITQPGLAGHLVGGFQVGAGGGFFDVAALDGAGRVHVHGHQCFGLVDHDGTAAGQLHRAGVGGFDLVLDLEAAEQWCVVAVTLHAVPVFGHHMVHELVGLLEDVVGVDQDFADVTVEVIANGADDQAGFLVDQVRAFAAFGCAVNGRPEFEQVIQIPLQFIGIAANASSTGNDAHAAWILKLIKCLLEFLPVFSLDASADTAATRVVGHQHHVTSCQAHERGECGTLVATFFFFHLDNEFLAFANHVLNACLADGYARCKVLAGNFLEWQKTMTVFAIVNKAGFQAGLNPGDHRFVDVAFALLAAFNLDFVVEQFLSIDDGQPAFFGLGGVDQHPLHDAFSFMFLRS